MSTSRAIKSVVAAIAGAPTTDLPRPLSVWLHARAGMLLGGMAGGAGHV